MQNGNEYNIDYWELISKILAGEANAHEHELFSELKGTDTTFAGLFEEARHDWDMFSNYTPVSDRQVDQAWMKQMQRIDQFESDKKMAVVRDLKITPVLRYAATIAILFALSFVGLKIYNYFESRSTSQIITRYYENKEEISLSDGTLITLNKGSRMTYPKRFGDSKRIITLQGEAFFEVMHDSERPFIINTSNAEIRVLGTSFNVACDNEKSMVEVFVESGKVQVNPVHNQKDPLILEPGFIGIVSDQQTAKSLNENENYLAWKTGKMIFKETPLSEVIKTLNKMYDVSISLNGNIESCKFTSTFSEQELDLVLDVICTSFNLKMKKDNNEIVLFGDGC